ncbi:ABC transporter permease subunit [Actinoplanes sp. NPDC026623]|uniref:ABC transporter permease subunit n=1 Tax=Actinoplanes sp. NPDC026623 TaxID=3155610 RepID=UPI0033FC14F6
MLLTTSHAYPAQIPEAARVRIQQLFGAADWASLTWCVAIVVLFHVVLTRTRWGLHTISVGGNLIGATEAGIRANRIKIGNFMIASMLGALILAELQNGFNLIGVSANPFQLILGSAILLSMIANQYLSRLRRTGGA